VKEATYHALVTARKSCRACAGLTNAAAIEGGRFDSDRIGPYSQRQGNLDSRLMVVAQDFADVAGFSEHRGWPGEDVGTNHALVDLLASIGIAVPLPDLDHSDDTLFFTNAVLCLKGGGMQRTVLRRHVRECAHRFLKPMIDLISPVAIAALGVNALHAVLLPYGLTPAASLTELIEKNITFDLPNGARVFPLCHPSRTVLNTHRALYKQRSDWVRVGDWLQAQM